MPTSDEQKKLRNVVFQADAFRMSIAMARVVYTRLVKTLDVIEPRFRATGTFDAEIASAYSDAWALVDILHRVRDLSEQTRLLSAKEPSVQVFIRATVPVKALRNHVQHFRSGIHQLPAESEPLFGTLTWVSAENSQRCFSIISGSLSVNLASAGSVYDRVDGVFLQRLRLAAGEGDMDLDDGFTALENFGRHLTDTLDKRGLRSLVDAPLGLATRLDVVRGES